MFWLTDRNNSRLRKTFPNNSSANIKLAKTQPPKIVQSGGFLGRLLGHLMRVGLPIMKSLVKSVLIPLGLTAAASTTDAAIQKKIHGSRLITLII